MATVKATPKLPLPTFHISATVHRRGLYWGVFDDDSRLKYFDRDKSNALAWIDRQAEHGKCLVAPWTKRRGGYMRRDGKRSAL